jgi:hypothetical protein
MIAAHHCSVLPIQRNRQAQNKNYVASLGATCTLLFQCVPWSESMLVGWINNHCLDIAGISDSITLQEIYYIHDGQVL